MKSDYGGKEDNIVMQAVRHKVVDIFLCILDKIITFS